MSQILLKLWLIGNRTSCRPIRSLIILVIKQIGLPLRGRPILLITRMITDRIGLHSVLLPYHLWYFKIVSNFTRLTAREITYNNFGISLVVFMPNITTNHAITYTNFSEILIQGKEI